MINDILLIAFGAILGFGASLGANFIINRKQREKEETEKAIDIILDVVKFFLKINLVARDTKEMMAKYWKDRREPIVAGILKEYRDKIEDMRLEDEVEELFREVQLQLVGNQDIREKFRASLDAYYDYINSFVEDTKTFEEKEAVYRKLYKEFMDLCVETCRANAPGRTLYAPRAKKEASHVS